MSKIHTLLSNLTFPEGPRWHDGMLWFSDFYSHEVITVDEKGTRNTIVSVPEQPSGLGWNTQGDLLIVSMRDQKLLRHSNCLLYTSPSPRDATLSRMPSSA